jgi:hypothetical protein
VTASGKAEGLANIVWLADTPWRRLDLRRKSLVAALRPFARLLFLEPPPSLRLPALSLESSDRIAIGQVAPLLNTRIRWAQAALRLWPLRATAAQAASYQVARLADANGWGDNSTRVVISSSVFLHRAARALRPDRLIVEINYDPRCVDEAPPWTPDLLMRSIHDADVVMTPSLKLAREFLRAGVERVQLLPSEPDGVGKRGIPHDVPVPPTVGYEGYIGPWFDFLLVDELARRCPELRIRLTGLVDARVSHHVMTLTRHPNVTLISLLPENQPSGTVPPAVVIVPFSGTVPQSDPRGERFENYVAIGAPIVSTVRPLSSEVRHHVDVCSSTDEFIQMVRLRSRRRTAESPLWDFAGSSFRRWVLEY